MSESYGSSNWVVLARTLEGNFDEAWSAMRSWQFPKDCETRQLFTQAMVCPEVYINASFKKSNIISYHAILSKHSQTFGNMLEWMREGLLFGWVHNATVDLISDGWAVIDKNRCPEQHHNCYFLSTSGCRLQSMCAIGLLPHQRKGGRDLLLLIYNTKHKCSNSS